MLAGTGLAAPRGSPALRFRPDGTGTVTTRGRTFGSEVTYAQAHRDRRSHHRDHGRHRHQPNGPHVADMGHRSPEARKPLAGDDLVPVPSAIETRSITIDAPPEASGRGSFRWASIAAAGTATTSSTCVGRARRRSCRSTRPSRSATSSRRSPTTGFIVREVQPGRALVLFSDTALSRARRQRPRKPSRSAIDPCPPASRLRRLLPDAAGVRRQLGLHARAPRWRPHSPHRAVPRAVRAPAPAFRLIGPIMGFGVFVMVRRQLLGIRERAESTAVAPPFEQVEVKPTEIKPAPAPANGRARRTRAQG